MWFYQMVPSSVTLRYFDDGKQVLGMHKSREKGKQDGVHWEEEILDQTYTIDGWNGLPAQAWSSVGGRGRA